MLAHLLTFSRYLVARFFHDSSTIMTRFCRSELSDRTLTKQLLAGHDRLDPVHLLRHLGSSRAGAADAAHPRSPIRHHGAHRGPSAAGRRRTEGQRPCWRRKDVKRRGWPFQRWAMAGERWEGCMDHGVDGLPRPSGESWPRQARTRCSPSCHRGAGRCRPAWVAGDAGPEGARIGRAGSEPASGH